MESSFSDGGPAVSYTSALAPGSGQQSPCVLAASETDPLYTLCPALQGQRQRQQQHQPETGSLPQGADDPPSQHHLSQLRGCPSRDHMTYYRPHQPRTQNIWLSSSPALNTKDVARISFQDPAAGTDAFHYNPSPVSSGTWPSPAQPFPHPIDVIQLQSQNGRQECLQICTPTSVDDYQMSDCDAGRPYTGPTHVYDRPSTTLRPHQPSPVSLGSAYSPAPLPSAAVSPNQMLTSAPAQMDSVKVEPLSSPEAAMQPTSTSRESSEQPRKGVLRATAAKKDEPYAKLIEKALRSRHDYSMQLQEIYQWFIANTDKARNFYTQPKESKGWQNSIRHNLSMNAAFTKRDEDRPGTGSATSAEQKRSTVWVLAPWAVRDGVQSTTRYRKINSSRRAGGARAVSQPYNLHLRPNPATRSVSGLPFDGGAGLSGYHGQHLYAPNMSMAQMPSNNIPQNSFLMRRSERLPYSSEGYAPSRIETVAPDPFREPDGLPTYHSPQPSQHFGMQMPDQNMVDGITDYDSPGGSYGVPHGLPQSLQFNLPQTPFPYGVQGAHIRYPCAPDNTTPGSNLIYESKTESYCGFDESEI